MKHTPTILFLIFLSAIAHSGVARAQRWLSYEPEIVELDGRLVIQPKYGPPNYGEDPKTDQKVRVPVLVLSERVNMIADRGDGFNAQPAYGIKQIQLAFIEGGIVYKNLVGQQVVVKGTLFHAHTGHHYTDVVMKVSSIERKPAGYGRQPVGVCSILTSYFNPREGAPTSNFLLAEFRAPVDKEPTEKSFKLPETGLIINVAVDYAHSSGEDFKPEQIGMAMSVSDKEENAMYASDNVLVGTFYKRGWYVYVSKQVVVGEVEHRLTLSCRDGSKQVKR